MASRRGFLRTMAGTALLTAGCSSGSATGGSSRTGSSAGSSIGSGTASSRSALAARAGAADLTALARGLQGKLIRPGDASYEDARRLFIPRFDSVRPAAVAYCAGPADVRECVLFARRSGMPVAVRCGGHNYAGWSTGTGLVIDVSPMDAVQASGGAAVVGAGTRLADLYDKLAASGVSVPAGSCSSVGVAGQTLGGGIGVVSRKYGLSCDAVTSMRIVTADGRLLSCDADHDADLYWACRGGGGGNFGIAVEFTFRTHPATDVTIFFYRWPWSSAAAVIGAWQDWGPHAPDELWSDLHIDAAGSAPSLQVGGLYLGDPQTCATLVEQVVARAGEPSSRFLRQVSYRHAMDVMGGCSAYSQAECHREGSLPGRDAGGKLAREDFAATSHVVSRPLPAAGIQELIGRFGNAPGRAVLLDGLGGAVGRIGPGDTAFPHRSALYSVQYIAAPGDRAWLREIRGAMNPYVGGTAYVNYPDPELGDWRRAYYGDNYDRLRKVKAAYDPDGLFRFPQAVRA